MKPKNKIIKNEQEINTMRQGGKLLAQVLDEISLLIKPEINVWDLEDYFIKFCKENKAIPACKNYAPYDMVPFPTGLCISINDQSVHCFPTKGRVLKEGDVITVDTVIKYKDLHVDAAFAKGVGKISENKQNLIETSEKSMYNAISMIKSGQNMGVVSHAFEEIARQNGCDVLRDYAGHGIGYKMHEYPQVPCYGNSTEGPVLISGMTICTESLVCEGKPDLIATAGWETRMRDKKCFAQFEHTVLVTDSGYEVLTKL